MPWIVGIDEAGYGPNLGPFVMTAVACRVPEIHATADLWTVLKKVTRRHTDPPSKRLIVADSKMVFSQTGGIAGLERSVRAFLDGSPLLAGDFVDLVCPECHEELRREVWYHGTTPLPLDADPEDYCGTAKALADHCKKLGITWGPIRSVVVCPAAFNAAIDKWDSKGAVLALSMVKLLRALPRDDDSWQIYVDKHGGRDTYAAHLQPAFDQGLVTAIAEGRHRSIYKVMDGGCHVQVTIEPRADANHFCVALASMASKYLRELLMLEFNRFWQSKVPEIKPTAGYPGDSKRFWADIRQAVVTLGIAENALWRRR